MYERQKVHAVCIQVTEKARRGLRSLGVGITDSYKTPDVFLGTCLGPLEEQKVLLSAKSSLQSQEGSFCV